MTTPDFDRLDQLVKWATEENNLRLEGKPSHWNQGYWFMRGGCGTTCCLAGQVAAEDGYQPVFHPTSVSAMDAVDAKGRLVYVPIYARDRLGLSVAQADCLFSATNNLEKVVAVVDAIKRGMDGGDLIRYHDDLWL